MARSKVKPILWLLFSGGGSVIALVLPVIILLWGVFRPMGLTPATLFDYNTLVFFFHNVIVKFIAFAVLTLLFWHAGHRFYLTLKDLYIAKEGLLAKVVCYGGAMLGTIAALIVLCVL